MKKEVLYPNQVKKILRVILKEKTPVMIWGAPGIGKSSLVKQICEEWECPMIDLRLSLLSPVDLRGLPHFDKKTNQAVWLKPEFLPTKGKGILFLDEINTASVSTQQAAYQLILDRQIGSYKFPENWRIVAAGNNATDFAYIQKTPAPLANRMIHLEVGADIEDWKEWAVGKVDSRVIAFLNFRPNMLLELPKEEVKAYCTPRSWDFVSKTIALYGNPFEAEDVIRGTVGEGATKEFLAFLQIYKKLPNIEGILKGEIHKVPKNADVTYALVSALVAKLKDKYLESFVNYTLKLSPEFATLALKDAAKSGWAEKLDKLPAFEKWAEKFDGYIK